MGAQLVEGLVVIGLAQVGQLVDDDHAQKSLGRLLEQCTDADLMPCIEAASLHHGAARVQAQGVVDHMDAAVVGYLVQRAGIAHVPALEGIHIVIEALVRAHGMGLGMLAQQPGLGLVIGQPATHL